MRRRGIGRAGRPSLLGTAARTAVVAGTATAVSGRVAERQAAAAPAVAPPPPQQGSAPTTITDVSELERLAALRQQGLLTDDEFTAAKAKVLGLAT